MRRTPRALVITAFPSFEEMLEVRDKVAAHPEIQRARAESGESQILVAAADSVRLREGRPGGIFELRSYHAPAWRDRPPAAAESAFRRAGIEPLLKASAAGEHVPRFTYMVAFEDLAERQEAWARLDADAGWGRMEAKVAGASIYKLAEYSPIA